MINSYSEAISYLKQFIPEHQKRFPGNTGLKRQAKLLKLLGNPQNKIKAIHIAGTSGKGSTAYYLSSLLISHKFKVGLTLSPHLIDLRERFQINNQLISKTEFVEYLNQIIPVINQVSLTQPDPPTFFEILTTLAFYIFYQKKVDYMVVETGLGGLMDGTNTVTSPKQVVVITKLGLDHTAVLGPDLASITTQKAGIIHPYNEVFSVHQHPHAQKVLDYTAHQKHTQVTYVLPKINFKNIDIKNQIVSYDYFFNNLNLKHLQLNTFATYQVENSALGLAVFQYLSSRDHFNLDIRQIRNTLSKVHFPGRSDCHQQEKQLIILDGAHNPQKMKSFISGVKKAYPRQKFTVILAFKTRNDFPHMIKMIIPISQRIILTSFKSRFQDMKQTSQPTSTIVSIFHKLNFSDYQIISNPQKALIQAQKYSHNIIITGSLYLISEFYPILIS